MTDPRDVEAQIASMKFMRPDHEIYDGHENQRKAGSIEWKTCAKCGGPYTDSAADAWGCECGEGLTAESEEHSMDERVAQIAAILKEAWGDAPLANESIAREIAALPPIKREPFVYGGVEYAADVSDTPIASIAAAWATVKEWLAGYAAEERDFARYRDDVVLDGVMTAAEMRRISGALAPAQAPKTEREAAIRECIETLKVYERLLSPFRPSIAQPAYHYAALLAALLSPEPTLNSGEDLDDGSGPDGAS